MAADGHLFLSVVVLRFSLYYDGFMSETVDIHKAAGILIRDRKLLVERSKGKEFFIAPGGSIEDGETAEEAVIRELMEEFQVTVVPEDLSVFGTFRAFVPLPI